MTEYIAEKNARLIAENTNNSLKQKHKRIDFINCKETEFSYNFALHLVNNLKQSAPNIAWALMDVEGKTMKAIEKTIYEYDNCIWNGNYSALVCNPANYIDLILKPDVKGMAKIGFAYLKDLF